MQRLVLHTSRRLYPLLGIEHNARRHYSIDVITFLDKNADATIASREDSGADNESRNTRRKNCFHLVRGDSSNNQIETKHKIPRLKLKLRLICCISNNILTH